MNELQLSDSLPIIETEIRQYQNLAGESIFEIGRRLKHVKENDLAHGEFGKWLQSVNISKDYSAKYIKVFDEFKDSNIATSRNLSISVLHELTQLPEPERTKEHVTEKGETKMPDEMTVRELRELKKKLKNQSETIDETTLQLKSREKENEILQSKLEEMENQDVEVKTVYKDRVPKHLEQQMKDKEQALIESKRSISELQAQLNKIKQKHQETYRREELTEDEQLGSRRFQAESNMLELVENMNEFLEVNAVNSFKQGAIAHSSERTKKLITEKVEEFEVFCRAMRTALNNQITIN